MKEITLQITSIIPYTNNPRRSSNVEEVKDSIASLGYRAKIVVDENNVILAGHSRYKALKELGYKEVEVILIDNLNEEQKKAFRIMSNKVGEFSSWQHDFLQEELTKLAPEESKLTLQYFTSFDVNNINLPTETKEILRDIQDEREQRKMFDSFVEKREEYNMKCPHCQHKFQHKV